MRLRFLAPLLFLLVGLSTFGPEARAQDPRHDGPRLGETRKNQLFSPEANQVAVDEMLGGYLDMDLSFVDHDGRQVRLGDYFDGAGGDRPVLITLNYFRCPTLCNLQLNALTRTLDAFEWTAGEQYRIVTVSIDPRETAE